MHLEILKKSKLDGEHLKHIRQETVPFGLIKGTCYQGWAVLDDGKSGYDRSPGICKPNGEVEKFNGFSKELGIRLATTSIRLERTYNNQRIIRNIDDRFYEIENGEYPQYYVELDQQEKLDDDLLSGKLILTGKTYTTHDTQYGQKAILKEVIDKDGNKYVNKNNTWYKVSPVVWILDTKTNLAVSKYIMTGGVGFGDLNPTRYHYEYKLKMGIYNIFDYVTRMSSELTPSEDIKVLELQLDHYDPRYVPVKPWEPCDPIPGRNPYEPCDPVPGREPWKITDPVPIKSPFTPYDPSKGPRCGMKIKSIGTKMRME